MRQPEQHRCMSCAVSAMATTTSPAPTPTTAARTTSQISSARTSARSVCGACATASTDRPPVHGAARTPARSPCGGQRAAVPERMTIGRGKPARGQGLPCGTAPAACSSLNAATARVQPAEPHFRAAPVTNPGALVDQSRRRAGAGSAGHGPAACRLQVVLDEGPDQSPAALPAARTRGPRPRAAANAAGQPPTMAAIAGSGRALRPARRRRGAPPPAPPASRRRSRCMPGGLTPRSRPSRAVSMAAACSSQSTARRGLHDPDGEVVRHRQVGRQAQQRLAQDAADEAAGGLVGPARAHDDRRQAEAAPRP